MWGVRKIWVLATAFLVHMKRQFQTKELVEEKMIEKGQEHKAIRLTVVKP